MVKNIGTHFVVTSENVGAVFIPIIPKIMRETTKIGTSIKLVDVSPLNPSIIIKKINTRLI